MAGEACVEADWLIGGDVDVPPACALVEGGAVVEAVGVSSSSSPWVFSRRRFWPRVELAFKPIAVALIKIWCLRITVLASHLCNHQSFTDLVRLGPH